MSSDSFKQRERSFEEEFFQKQERKLVDKLRETLDKQQTREELEQLTGVKDPGVLDTLIAMNIAKDTFAGFALFVTLRVSSASASISTTPAPRSGAR